VVFTLFPWAKSRVGGGGFLENRGKGRGQVVFKWIISICWGGGMGSGRNQKRSIQREKEDQEKVRDQLGDRGYRERGL